MAAAAPPGDPSWAGGWVREPPGTMGLGLGLVAASQALQAVHMYVDRERRWREQRARRLSPLGVVGCEGLIGAALAAALLPALARGPGPEGFGLREDTFDTLRCLWRSWELRLVAGAQLAAMFLYNVFLVAAAADLDLTRTTLLQAARTLLVWAANLALHAAGPKHLGEPLSRWSALQAAGFAAAVAGAALYARGDDERARLSLRLEAALIMLDQPPPGGPGSTVSGYSVATWRSQHALALAAARRGMDGGGGGYGYGGAFGLEAAGGGGGESPAASPPRAAPLLAGAIADFDAGCIGRSMLYRSPLRPVSSLSRRGASAADLTALGGGAGDGASAGDGDGGARSPPWPQQQ